MSMLQHRLDRQPPRKFQTAYTFSDVFGYQPGNNKAPSRYADFRDALYERKILIVEDEAMIGFALELELEDVGATPIGPVTTLSGALDLLETTTIDGAILDINLNGVDVYPLADHLIERGISFVFHTAHGNRKELRDIYPGVPVCIKPSNTDEVLNALGKVFRDRSRN